MGKESKIGWRQPDPYLITVGVVRKARLGGASGLCWVVSENREIPVMVKKHYKVPRKR